MIRFEDKTVITVTLKVPCGVAATILSLEGCITQAIEDL